MAALRTSIAAALAFIVLAAAASAQSEAPKFKVATTFTVIADMVRNVAGDTAEVVSITRPGAEIHNYQPTPGDIIATSDADLVLWNGLNLELWFEPFFERLGDVPSAVLTEGIEPMGIGEGPYSGKPNPHAWMSFSDALTYVDNIRDALTGLNPAGAAIYEANAEAYKAQIMAARDEIRAIIDTIPEDRRWLVTSEGAFSYLARDLGLHDLYLWPINADSQGTPQQVRKVIDAVHEHQIPAVFSESTVSDKPARQVARETGAHYGGVLYVELAVRGGRAGADLSRPPARHDRDDRQGPARGGLGMNDAASATEVRPAPAVPGIRAQGLTVTYRNGLTALTDASFEVPVGSICALVGVNGSGKSTLFKAIMGFAPLARGSVELMGAPAGRALKRNIVAYVPQNEDIDWNFPVLVEDVVMMGRYGHMGMLRIPRRADRAAVESALERVGMERYAERQIGELSGGQKKRVFLARALAQDAQVILLDEPFTGVDVKTEARIVALMRDLRDEGRVMLVSTHNLGSVPQFCDHVVLINRTILAYGPTPEVFTQANIERAFGGTLRHFVLGGAELHDDEDSRRLTVITDDEHPFVVYGDANSANPPGRPAEPAAESAAESRDGRSTHD